MLGRLKLFRFRPIIVVDDEEVVEPFEVLVKAPMLVFPLTDELPVPPVSGCTCPCGHLPVAPPVPSVPLVVPVAPDPPLFVVPSVAVGSAEVGLLELVSVVSGVVEVVPSVVVGSDAPFEFDVVSPLDSGSVALLKFTQGSVHRPPWRNPRFENGDVRGWLVVGGDVGWVEPEAPELPVEPLPAVVPPAAPPRAPSVDALVPLVELGAGA